ncbi:MAG: hypothetical protein M1526_02140 [Candidatus Thermoplasmatota archaeon]|jgi:RPA family protein|nr:hypothetical protein [Candidatus Thermoplasmatota archaeon]
MNEREPAVRASTLELSGIDEMAEYGEERKAKYGLTETGLLVNRFLLGAQYLSKMDEDNRTVVKVKDSFNELFLYVGEFYSQSLEKLDELEQSDDLMVIGKVSLSTNQGYLSKRFYAESIIKISEATRKYLEAETVHNLDSRLRKITKIISAGIRDEDEIAKIMESPRYARGIKERLEKKGSVDIEKFRSSIEHFIDGNKTGNRDVVLNLIKSFREITYEEIIERTENKVGAEEIDQIINNLLAEGEITEIKSGVYKYIP